MFSLRKNLFFWVLIAYWLYGCFFIYQTSFVINGERYFSLFDDAMISMRYAKNLVHGYGFVWNPGEERVEGFTNPLWTGFMAFFHLFPIPPAKLSLTLQISGLCFLSLNLFGVKRLADLVSPAESTVSLPVVLLTAFYLPLNTWGLQGMEVSILTLLLTFSLWDTLRNMQEKRFSPWPYLLLGVGTLIRIDLAVPLLALTLILSFLDQERRKHHLIAGISSLVGFLGCQTLLRLWYFGDILPNTYYLKMTGYPFLLRISRGGYIMLQFIWSINLVFLLGLGLLWFRRSKPLLILGWMLMAQMLYSLYVGGDAWEDWIGCNRYICIAMPLLFILFCLGLEQLKAYLQRKMKQDPLRLLVYGSSLLFILSFIELNSCYLANIPNRSLTQWALLEKPVFVRDNEKNLRRILLINELTKPKARIALSWAGEMAYFTDHTTLDLLGKTDKKVAHEEMHLSSTDLQFTSFLPGHLKWDHAYALGQFKPDVVDRIWVLQKEIWQPAPGTKTPLEEAQPYLERDYNLVKFQGITFGIYFRKDSPNILWAKLSLLQSQN